MPGASLIKACILVGGPSVGTRFRPLSLDCPKPLFPVAGVPMIHHHIAALAKVEGLQEILIIGFFENGVFDGFLRDVHREFPALNIRYLREYQALGTGGGLYHFRDEILRGNPEYFFCIHADICSSFPLEPMVAFHKDRAGLCTILGTHVPRETVNRYGCLVASPEDAEVLHYVEKPEHFTISDLVSCGVYLFSTDIFAFMKEVTSSPHRHHSSVSLIEDSFHTAQSRDRVRLEQDVLRPLAGTKRLYVYTCGPKDFFMQIKTAESAVPANRLYLSKNCYQQSQPLSPVASPIESPRRDRDTPDIVEPVYIDPSAHIHPTAKVGPYVSVGKNVTIGPGVRVRDSILLDDVAIAHDSCVINSVLGWGSKVGCWVRLEGVPMDEGHEENTIRGMKVPGATILGREVTVADEQIIRSCIVLPHKELKNSYHNEILM